MSARVGAALALGLACAAPRAAAQTPPAAAADTALAGVEVSTGVVPDTVTVGDPFRSIVRIVAPPGARVAFPELALTDSLQPVGPPALTRDGATGAATAVYPLVAWAAGGPRAARVPVRVVAADGSSRTIRVALRLPVVRSVLPADTAGLEPRPAKGIAALPERAAPWWAWLLAALAALGLAAGWLAGRARRPSAPVPAPPARSPREEALARLDALRASSRADPAAGRALYEEVSRVLRRYLARLSPAWSGDLTTRELCAELRRGGAPGAAADRLERLLGEADRVKFSGQRPDTATAAGCLDEARHWVETFVEPRPARGEAAA